MSNPKRVWDSKKRAVRQGKEQVWLVDGEKKVNTNHGFAEATGTDVVYNSSWEEAQTPLQTYDNRWENIPTPPSSSIRINRELSETSGYVGDEVKIYFYCENAVTIGDVYPYFEFKEIINETGEGYNRILVLTVEEAGSKDIVIEDNITGDTDSIECTGVVRPPFIPGENTAYYYPFENDTLDVTGNTHISVTGTKGTEGYNFSVIQNNQITKDVVDAPQCNFLSTWIRYNGPAQGTDWPYPNTPSIAPGEMLYNYGHQSAEYQEVFQIQSYNTWPHSEKIEMEQGVWYHIVMGYQDGVARAYVNGEKVWERNAPTNNIAIPVLGKNIDEDLSDFIGESVCWTDEQIATYYQATRSSHPLPPVTEGEFSSASYNVDETVTTSSALEYSPSYGDYEGIEIISDDSSIVQVNSYSLIAPGVLGFEIEGVAEGTTTIYATYNGGSSFASATVNVGPYVHVESLSQGESEITLMQSANYEYSMPITPSYVSDAASEITVEIDDDDIVTGSRVDVNSGRYLFTGVGQGTTQAHYYLNSAPDTVYDIDITVTPAVAHYNLRNADGTSWESDTRDVLTSYAGETPVGDVPCSQTGTSKYFYTENALNGLIQGNSDFTFAFWAKPYSFTAGNAYNNFVSLGASGSYSNACVFYHGGTLRIGGWSNDRDTELTLSLNEWSHVAVTHSNGTAKVYVNGVLGYTGSVNYDIASGGHMLLGAGLSPKDYFDGLMNEVIISNKEYTAQEISDIYQNGIPTHVYINATQVDSISIQDGQTESLPFTYTPTTNAIADKLDTNGSSEGWGHTSVTEGANPGEADLNITPDSQSGELGGTAYYRTRWVDDVTGNVEIVMEHTVSVTTVV